MLDILIKVLCTGVIFSNCPTIVIDCHPRLHYRIAEIQLVAHSKALLLQAGRTGDIQT